MNSEKKREQLRLYEKSEKRKAYQKSEKRKTRNNELRRLRRSTKEGKEKQKEYKQSASGRFADIKHHSKRRKIDFQITLEEFTDLYYEKQCAYCGDIARGIDRIDSSGHYIVENCAPCCSTCNDLKGILSIKEFDEKISKIFAYRMLDEIIKH
jgi:5-methylcytosine-specific restriction endonuclease McrA